MSQIGSSGSGVRVAAQPLSNIYTVLLLVAAVALVFALVWVCAIMDQNYGVVLALSEEGKANKELPEKIEKQQEDQEGELEQVDRALERFPEGVSAAPETGGAAEDASGGAEGGGPGPAPDSGGAGAPDAGSAEPAGG